MHEYKLAFKPAVGAYGYHDPSAAIFDGNDLLFAIEEERLNRQKHAVGCFPVHAIESCLDHCDITLDDVDRILLPYKPKLETKILRHKLHNAINNGSIPERIYNINEELKEMIISRYYSTLEVERELERNFKGSIPPIHEFSHHKCHASSAYYHSGFDEALVVTIDGKGEYDSTVIWKANKAGLERLKTYEFPNSLGHFYGTVTEFLGFQAFNGEGKVMGLAPYGEENKSIQSKLYNLIDGGWEYDVTPLTEVGDMSASTSILEELFSRDKKVSPTEFTEWEKDLAYSTQKILEEIVSDIIREFIEREGISNIALAGGVALNCKMNKKIMEVEGVNELFIQPIAHDAGLAIGAGFLHDPPSNHNRLNNVYLGPSFSKEDIVNILEENKLEYEIFNNAASTVATALADGKLVGWFTGRLEMGPRALGGRSILADPRTAESRDRVNKYVKHREEWRPFAPVILEEHADEYLQNAEASPFMIKTFDTVPESREEIEAVLHPGDHTTRPQTIRRDQNQKYYDVVSEFEKITGVPVLLNTSFNDHAEPIVNKPVEAIKDFYGMGLDLLVLEDIVIKK